METGPARYDRTRRPTKTPEQKDRERLARIETRITSLALHMGVDVPCAKPTFIAAGLRPGSNELGAAVHLPSVNSVVREVLGAIPADFTGPVDLVIRGETIGRIVLADRT